MNDRRHDRHHDRHHDGRHGERRILLGTIVAAHGIRGEVIVKSYTGAPADIASYGTLSDADGASPLSLSVVRVSEKGVVARVAGVNDRNGAEALAGRSLYVRRERLPETADDTFYHADLVGLQAFGADGTLIGKVIGVQNYGAGDLLEIQCAGVNETELIPFTNACVPEVDVAGGRLTVLPPAMFGEPEPRGESDGDDNA